MAEKPDFSTKEGREAYERSQVGKEKPPTTTRELAERRERDKPTFGAPEPVGVERERELREAVKHSELVGAGGVRDDEDRYGPAYWKSVEDIKSKLEVIEQAKKVGAGELVAERPEEYEKYVRGAVSPFATIGSGGMTFDVVSALKSGRTEEDLKSMGVSQTSIDVARGHIAEQARVRQENIKVRIYNKGLEDTISALRGTDYDKGEGMYNVEGAVAAGVITRVQASTYFKAPVPSIPFRQPTTGLSAVDRERLLAGGVTAGAMAQYAEKKLSSSKIAQLLQGSTTTPSFETWLAGKGMTPTLRSQMTSGEIEELRTSYEVQYKGKYPLEKWATEKPYAAIGALALPLAVITAPTWAPYVVPSVVGTTKFLGGVGAAGTLLTGVEITRRGASMAPSLEPGPLEQRLGWYGRGTEQWWKPLMEKGRGTSPWYSPRGLGMGMVGYIAPHESFAQLYPTKGALAATVLIPHFGPTAAYTALAWKELSPLQRGIGIGGAVLPYAVGPLGAAAGWAGRGVGRVPVLGTVLRGVTWAPRQVLRGAGEVMKPVSPYMPWQAAYKASGLVGKAGLGRIPRLGSAGMRFGWWPKEAVPYGMWPKARPMTPGELEVARSRYLGESEKLGYTKVATPEGDYSLNVNTGRWEISPPGTFEAEVALQRGKMLGPSVVTVEAPGAFTWAGRASVSVPTAPLPPPTSPFQTIGRFVPRIATATAVMAVPWATTVAPSMIGAPSFLPITAPTVAQQVQTDVQVMNRMLEQNQITQAQHQQMLQQINQTQQEVTTQQEYSQQISSIADQTLTQVQHQQMEQQQMKQQQQQQPLQQMNLQQMLQMQQVQQLGQIQKIQQVQDIIQQQEIEKPIIRPIPPIIPLFPPWPKGLGGGGGAGVRLGDMRKVGSGIWEFGPAGLYVPGAEGPVRGPVGYGAVAQRKRRDGIKGTRIAGSSLGTTRQYVPTYAV